MCVIDRIIRFIVVLVFTPLIYYKYVEGILEYVLVIGMLLFLFTSISGFCPFYKSVNLSTCSKDNFLK